jgi:hypothetical protein
MENWLGIALTVLGLLFGLYERRERIKTSSVMRDTLRRLAGDTQVVYSNANWAEMHCRKIAKSLMEPDPILKLIAQEAVDGARDSTACKRQLVLVYSRIRGIQKTLFNDTVQILPEIDSADVQDARRNINEAIARGRS